MSVDSLYNLLSSQSGCSDRPRSGSIAVDSRLLPVARKELSGMSNSRECCTAVAHAEDY